MRQKYLHLPKANDMQNYAECNIWPFDLKSLKFKVLKRSIACHASRSALRDSPRSELSAHGQLLEACCQAKCRRRPQHRMPTAETSASRKKHCKNRAQQKLGTTNSKRIPHWMLRHSCRIHLAIPQCQA